MVNEGLVGGAGGRPPQAGRPPCPPLDQPQNHGRNICADAFGVTMKTYEGKRTIDGLVVTVDGKPLDERYDVKQFTRYGFEWTYEGESPQQLALAILVDYVGDKERAVRLSAPFMKSIVANLDNDWTLQGDDIDAFLKGAQA
jgi:hypothetical protein